MYVPINSAYVRIPLCVTRMLLSFDPLFFVCFPLEQDVITNIRKVKKDGKAKGIWDKNVEIAYQDFIYKVNYMLSPNTDRNPDKSY